MGAGSQDDPGGRPAGRAIILRSHLWGPAPSLLKNHRACMAASTRSGVMGWRESQAPVAA